VEKLEDLTPAQKLAQIRDAIGMPVYLRPYEKITQMCINDTGASITIDTYSYDEMKYEVRFTGHASRMRSWMKLADGSFMELPPITIWDDDFQPFTERIRGHSISPEEYNDRRDWEAMTHRPGTSHTPLDSCSRTLEDAGTESDKMYRYWVGHSRHLPHTTETDKN